VISNGGRSIDAVVCHVHTGNNRGALAGSCPLLESRVRPGRLNGVTTRGFAVG
jgi:hypothetical protein